MSCARELALPNTSTVMVAVEMTARGGRPVDKLTLTDEERRTLTQWAWSAHSPRALSQRCQIVLGCAAGKSNKQVSAELGISQQTVGKWRRRFLLKRLDGLTDEPRPGAPRRISDEQIEQVVAATLSGSSSGAEQWSRASMADAYGLSRSTVGRIWKAFGLQPHLLDNAEAESDP
jgi:transposase